jgi:hypothetical protein
MQWLHATCHPRSPCHVCPCLCLEEKLWLFAMCVDGRGIAISTHSSLSFLKETRNPKEFFTACTTRLARGRQFVDQNRIHNFETLTGTPKSVFEISAFFLRICVTYLVSFEVLLLLWTLHLDFELRCGGLGGLVQFHGAFYNTGSLAEPPLACCRGAPGPGFVLQEWGFRVAGENPSPAAGEAHHMQFAAAERAR